MESYTCALLSSHNYLVDQAIDMIGLTFRAGTQSFEQHPLKYTEFTIDTESRTQNILQQLNLKQFHAIVIVIRFDRTDLMRRDIESFSLHLSQYKNNIVILVCGIPKYKDNLEDLQSIKELLSYLSLKAIIEDEKCEIQNGLSQIVQQLDSVQINLSNYFGEYNEEYFTNQLNQAIVIRRFEQLISQSNSQDLNPNERNIDHRPNNDNGMWTWTWMKTQIIWLWNSAKQLINKFKSLF